VLVELAAGHAGLELLAVGRRPGRAVRALAPDGAGEAQHREECEHIPHGENYERLRRLGTRPFSWYLRDQTGERTAPRKEPIVYVDVNIRLMKNLTSFIDFDNDRLWLIKDVGPGRYWQAMMAARRRHPQLLVALKGFMDSIHNHSYGENNLDITGPQALYRHLHADPNILDRITVKYELREEISKSCGGLRQENKPPCPVKVWPVNDTNESDVVALKDLSLHSQEWQHSSAHYIERYLNRSVYCDEPGPPCL